MIHFLGSGVNDVRRNRRAQTPRKYYMASFIRANQFTADNGVARWATPLILSLSEGLASLAALRAHAP